MASEYQLTATDIVIRNSDGAHIPNDPDNRDRVEYDGWLEAGGVPDPYVPPETAPPPTAMAWSDGYEAKSGVVSVIDTIGQIGFDNADPTAATQVFMAKNNQSDTDISTVFLVAMQAGRVLRIENRSDSSIFAGFMIESVESRDTDLAVTVTPRNSAGVLVVAPRGRAAKPKKRGSRATTATTQDVSVGVYEVAGAPPSSKSVV